MKKIKKLLDFILITTLIVLIISCNGQKSEVKHHIEPKVKNIILLIGDGMGVSQIYAALTANNGHLNLERCKYIGFSKTYSSNDYITDSGAGGTAIAIGKKTYNGAIGVDADSVPHKSILEIAEENGLSTGLVVTCSITHATPASFIAHQLSRKMYEEIAADFLKTDIDVFIGGGKDNFIKREDGRNLTEELIEKDYQVVFNMNDIKKIKSGKLAGLIADGHISSYIKGRRDMLPEATEVAINILKQNKKGFFLMVEGSQIDWGGHDNDTEYIIEETLDFDKAIAKALDFAEQDGNTLVIITADHETGGMGINNGNIEKGDVIAKYTTGNHSGVMVPVFAFGPGAEEFIGIYENTDLFKKMMKVYGFCN